MDLIDALRAKYKSPADALRALGLDASLLHKPCRAKDADPEPAEPEHDESGELLETLRRLTPKQIAALRTALGLVEKEGEEEEEGEEPENEPSPYDEFEPDEPEGKRAEKIAAVTRDRDALPRVGKTAMDAKLAFDRRFPQASRVVSNDSGLFAATPDRGATRKPQSAAAAASFFDRYPGAKRIA